MKRRNPLLLSALVLVALTMAPLAGAQFQSARLDAGLTAATQEADRLLVALPLVNEGPTTAVDVRVTRAVLANLPNVTVLPIAVGTLEAGKSFVVQLQFAATGALDPERRYHVIVGGTYRIGTSTLRGFEVNGEFRVQPAEGAGETIEVDVMPSQADGAIYPPDPRGFRPDEANEEEPSFPIPEGPLRGALMPDETSTEIPGIGGPGIEPQFQALAANDPVRFYRVGQMAVQDRITDLFPWDPSGGSVDVVGRPSVPLVFLTGNTYMLWSTNGGQTFSRVDPTTIFPNTMDGGLCCDQVVQYVPSINRVLWFMQFRRGAGTNTNRIRIASASPQQILSSGATQWTYWDMTSALFNLGNNWMDYPDLAFTNSFLHISTDRVGAGLFVIRAPLAEIRDSQTLHLRYTNPSNGAVAYGGHLTQDSPDAAYWFGHASTSSLRIFEWPDNSTSYSWRTIDVDSWSDSSYSTTAPNGVNWLDFGFGRAAIRGATYRGTGQLGEKLLTIAWSAGRAGGFAQPYVRLLHLARFDLFGTTFWGKSEAQIWNSSYAFQHPYLTTNSDGEVGISLGYGGPSNHATPIVGFVGDGTLYQVNVSSTTISRWGDYSAIRKHGGNARLFSVSNYYLQSDDVSGVTGGRVVHQYLLFGRDTFVEGPR